MTTDHTGKPPAKSRSAAEGARERDIAAALGAIADDFTNALLIAADAESSVDLDSLADQLALLAGAVERATQSIAATAAAAAAAESGDEHGTAVVQDSLRAALRDSLKPPGLFDRLVHGAWEHPQPVTMVALFDEATDGELPARLLSGEPWYSPDPGTPACGSVIEIPARDARDRIARRFACDRPAGHDSDEPRHRQVTDPLNGRTMEWTQATVDRLAAATGRR